MSRTRKRKRRGRRFSTPQPVTVDSLLNAGDWPEALALAQAENAADPTDERRRKLAECHFVLDDYRSAADVLKSISHQSYDDRLFIGKSLCLASDWDNAQAELEVCVKEQETPDACYWLARSLAKGNRWKHELNGGREQVRSLLTKSRQFGSRIPNVYLWLADLTPDRYGGASEEVESVLRDGLAVLPDEWSIREELAKHICRAIGREQEALELLAPRLKDPAPSLKALWIAKDAEESRGNWQGVLNCLNRAMAYLPDPQETFGMRLIRGDLLLRHDRVDEAVQDFRHEVAKPHPAAKCLGSLALAYAAAKQQRVLQAFSHARNAVDSWLAGGHGLVSYGWPVRLVAIDQISIDPPFHVSDVADFLEPHIAGEEDEVTVRLLKYWGADWYCSQDERIELAQKMPPKQFPVTNHEWSIIAAREGDIVRALSYFIAFVEKFGSMPEVHESYRCNFFEEKQFSWEKCFRSAATADKVHAKLFDFTVRHKQEPDFLEWTVLPLYRKIWNRILFDRKMWQSLYEVAGFLQQTFDHAAFELFDFAYAASELGKNEEAEEAYRRLIELEPENGSALHNLSILVEPRALDEALDLQRRAVFFDKANQKKLSRLAGLEEKVEQQRVEKDRREDFLKTARERWPQLDYFKRKLLGALTIINNGFDNWAHLAQLTGIDERYLPGHWRKLVDDGFIIGEPGNYTINEYVRDLISQERSHAVATTIVRADPTIAFKPIFNSKKEYEVYKVLLELFPNHLVFPNMALLTIFQYDRMKELLEPSDFDYFLRSQVDFCITLTSNYLPLIAFEVDSDFHDEAKQIVRDERKNRIFQKGGINLLRLRPHGRPSEGGLRHDIVKVVRQLGKELRESSEKTQGMVRLTLEVDFDHFGGVKDDD